jgi:hypothetical protein
MAVSMSPGGGQSVPSAVVAKVVGKLDEDSSHDDHRQHLPARDAIELDVQVHWKRLKIWTATARAVRTARTTN